MEIEMQADFFESVGAQGLPWDEDDSMHFYKRDPKTMMIKTRGLTDEQFRALETVIDLFISEDGASPDNGHCMCGYLPWNVRKWGRIKAELVALGQLEIRSGRLHSHLAEQLLKECLSFRENRRKLIEKRWRKS